MSSERAAAGRACVREVGAGGELFEQGGRDGQEVAPGEFDDLADIAKAGSHDLGRMAELFVVIEDAHDRLDAGIWAPVYSCPVDFLNQS